MALDDTQLAILETELTDDPKSLGYTSDDPDCADMLNEVGGSNETIPNTSISVSEVKLAIDPDETPTVHVNNMLLFSLLMNSSVDVSENSDLEISLKKIFAGCTNTLSALSALRTRSASRAEVLFGAGIRLNDQDVGKARLI